MTGTYQVNIYRTGELDVATRREIINICNLAFEGRELFEPLFDFIQEGGVHALGRLDGMLVSHAVYGTRWMQVNEGPLLRCAFVDAVATLPEHRHKGYGAQVMRSLAQEMALEGYQMGGLSTGSPAFYESTGWMQWRGILAGRTATGLVILQPEDPVMVLRLPGTPDFDIERDQLSIEEQGNRIWG